MSVVESPELYLKKGRELMAEAPVRCRDCAEALQGACEVAKLAIQGKINEATAGVYLGIAIKTQCNRSITDLLENECSFIIEPGMAPGDASQPVSEAIVEAVEDLNAIFPDGIPSFNSVH